jgi:DedD protein
VSTQTHDDGFHEIQLNGKQLVFLFMAATVVSVVIFLCGVLVGRGVQTEQSTPADTLVLNDGPAPDATATTPPTEASVAPESDPRAAEAPPAVDDLSYFSRLEQSRPPAESLRPAEAPARRTVDPPAQRTAEPPSRPAAAPPASPPAAASRTSPPAQSTAPAAASGSNAPAAAAAGPVGRPVPGEWAVQVAALNARPEAEAVAKRLSSKGYAAYVVTPGDGTPSVFRVRIGPFRTRREADSTAAKLEKEEQIKPWVTR